MIHTQCDCRFPRRSRLLFASRPRSILLKRGDGGRRVPRSSPHRPTDRPPDPYAAGIDGRAAVAAEAGLSTEQEGSGRERPISRPSMASLARLCVYGSAEGSWRGRIVTNRSFVGRSSPVDGKRNQPFSVFVPPALSLSASLSVPLSLFSLSLSLPPSLSLPFRPLQIWHRLMLWLPLETIVAASVGLIVTEWKQI